MLLLRSDEDYSAGDTALQTAQLRRRCLIVVILSGLVWTGLIQIPASLDWVPLGKTQARNNLLFVIVNAVALFATWRWPLRYLPIALVYFACSFAYVSAAQFLVVEDQLRMLLYFPATGAIFLIAGNLAGWIAIVGAIGVVAAAIAQGRITVSPLAASTFVLTLSITGLFFQAFSRQATRALTTIARQNRALDAAAKEDHLTHLLNLRAFRAAMQAHVDGLRPDHGFTVAFLDVDHFKAINDRHGHAIGDAVLVAVAGALKDNARPDAEVARIGGEEFAVLLPGTDLAEAREEAERLRAAVEATRIEAGGSTLAVTVSIGIAASRSSFDTIDTLLRAADAAMYAAKRDGRNRVALARPEPAGADA